MSIKNASKAFYFLQHISHLYFVELNSSIIIKSRKLYADLFFILVLHKPIANHFQFKLFKSKFTKVVSLFIENQQ